MPKELTTSTTLYNVKCTSQKTRETSHRSRVSDRSTTEVSESLCWIRRIKITAAWRLSGCKVTTRRHVSDEQVHSELYDRWLCNYRHLQGYHFSRISGNLEMSEKKHKGQAICVVTEICKASRLVNRWTGIMPMMHKYMCAEHHITYLYFIRTFNSFCISDVQHFEMTSVSCWNATKTL